MKTIFTVILIVLAVLACGCTATAPQAAPAPAPAGEPAIPNLVGTWTGTTLGYESGRGFTDYGNVPFTLVITEQQDRVFTGSTHLASGDNGKSRPVAGIIARDGRTLAIVEENNGYTTGEITGPDTIELTWRNDRAPVSAALDILKRAK
jgi:hypothetical protein